MGVRHEGALSVMRIVAVLILLALQVWATLWGNDPELSNICTGAAILMLLTGACRHAR
jgi:hypothetical protein